MIAPARFIPWLYAGVIVGMVVCLAVMAVSVAMLSSLLAVPPRLTPSMLATAQSAALIACARACLGFLISLAAGVILYAIGAAFGWLKPLPPAFERGDA